MQEATGSVTLPLGLVNKPNLHTATWEEINGWLEFIPMAGHDIEAQRERIRKAIRKLRNEPEPESQ